MGNDPNPIPTSVLDDPAYRNAIMWIAQAEDFLGRIEGIELDAQDLLGERQTLVDAAGMQAELETKISLVRDMMLAYERKEQLKSIGTLDRSHLLQLAEACIVAAGQAKRNRALLSDIRAGGTSVHQLNWVLGNFGGIAVKAQTVYTISVVSQPQEPEGAALGPDPSTVPPIPGEPETAVQTPKGSDAPDAKATDEQIKVILEHMRHEDQDRFISWLRGQGYQVDFQFTPKPQQDEPATNPEGEGQTPVASDKQLMHLDPVLVTQATEMMRRLARETYHWGLGGVEYHSLWKASDALEEALARQERRTAFIAGLGSQDPSPEAILRIAKANPEGEGQTPVALIVPTTIVRAPLRGRVFRLWVVPGDSVEAGDRLLTIGAMMLENEVRSPITGIVQSVHVAVGQLVDQEEALLIISTSPADAAATKPEDESVRARAKIESMIRRREIRVFGPNTYSSVRPDFHRWWRENPDATEAEVLAHLDSLVLNCVVELNNKIKDLSDHMHREGSFLNQIRGRIQDLNWIQGQGLADPDARTGV